MKMLSLSPKQYQEQKQSTQVKCGKRNKFIWFVLGHTQQYKGLIRGSGLRKYSWLCLRTMLDARIEPAVIPEYISWIHPCALLGGPQNETNTEKKLS